MSMQENLKGDENTASQRHWLYGFNLVVLVLVGVVALIMLFYFVEQDKVKARTKWDWTSYGANSLSPGTVQTIKQINDKGQKFQIWSLFTDAPDELKREQPEKAKIYTVHRTQINDLLKQYARASGNITVEDRGDASIDDISRQIREKYAGELKPYEETIKDFAPLADKLSDFLKKEAAVIGAMGQKAGNKPDEIEAAAGLQAGFASAPAGFDQIKRIIDRESRSTLPQWDSLKSVVREPVDQLEAMFSSLSDTAALKKADLPPLLVTYFESAAGRYREIEKELKAYQQRLDDLKPLEVKDILNGLDRNTIVVLGEKSARVIPQEKIYNTAPGDRGSAGGEQFLGEQSVSSALFGISNPDKVKVVFVSASPAHLLDDTYSDMKDTLEQNNFQVFEWSPPSPPQPGSPPPTDTVPPAQGKGVIWVVFPPETPSMQAMMMGMTPNAGPVIAATREHMGKGGQVLFMAEAGVGPMGGGTYAYADLLKDFGIVVESKYAVLRMQTGRDPDTNETITSPTALLTIKDYPNTEITRPMQSLMTAFAPSRSAQDGFPTEVRLSTPVPQEAEASVLAATPFSSEYWGETELGGAVPKFDKDRDLQCPPGGIPLAAISIRNKGKENEQRVAVIGAKALGSNDWLRVSQTFVENGILQREQMFPGNEELMKNTILWLGGYNNMIAVSAKANPTGRIEHVAPRTLLAIQLLVLPGLPILALLVGGIVWTSRRR